MLCFILVMFVLWVFAANSNDKRRSKGNFTTSEFLTMYFNAQDRARKNQGESDR